MFIISSFTFTEYWWTGEQQIQMSKQTTVVSFSSQPSPTSRWQLQIKLSKISDFQTIISLVWLMQRPVDNKCRWLHPRASWWCTLLVTLTYSSVVTQESDEVEGEKHAKPRKTTENHKKPRKTTENHGKPWKTMENHHLFRVVFDYTSWRLIPDMIAK